VLRHRRSVIISLESSN